jgi:predicted CopG family antitoxin
MAVKTVTIDFEAYDTLARHKKHGQSFSQVITLHFGPQKTAGSFLRALRETVVSAGTTGAIDLVVRSRKGSRARVRAL